MSRLLDDLNDAQREAVQTTEGPLLIIAGAGSGKTRVLTRRLAYILTRRLAQPHEILAVTFTNKAAGEMKERVAALLGGAMMDMNVSTFHSFCARFLRREGGAIGYGGDFTIFDAADSETLMKSCIKALNLPVSQFAPKAQLRKVSNAKNRFQSAEGFARSAGGYFEQRTAQLYSLYQARLRECNAMDFDDLLLNTVALLQQHSEIGERYRSRFRYLLVDEYQDTNHVQYLLLKSLVGPHRNICVVGDEDQSIYGWRGADIRNILDFEHDFPGAKVIKLEMNYRSTDVILAAASAVIAHNVARKDKVLRTTRRGGEKISLLLVDSAEEEAERVIDLVVRDRSRTPLSEMVILYRTNAQSRAFEEQLRRRAIPYQIVGGISFYQRKEIKDLLAYLKLIVNPKDDISFGRIVNYPKRGLGDKSLADLGELTAREGKSLYETATLPDPDLSGLGARAVRQLRSFTALIERYREQQDAVSTDLLVGDLIRDLGLLEAIRAEEEEIVAATRIENLEAFIGGVADYTRHRPHATLAEYLAEISLFTDIDEYNESEDKLALMSVHSAKGLEFDTVFIVGLEEGLFPLARTVGEEMELEEERRLFYVGSTRARHKLYLASATARFRFGQSVSIPSRFIKEVPDHLIERTDFRTNRHYELVSAGDRPATARDLPLGRLPAEEGVHYEYEEEEALRVGRLVRHPTFGRGKVLKVEGRGESLMLEIHFQGLGVKRVMAKYARLTVIG
ncbi:MAG TPA: UvrD-helicase domain-containing protein [candidate division Zixibacteria bacterium]|nr:UvrD-helicase domain-containing protein [candidate division Zixibacteria bacterium]MDD4918319.1 UvrD-helicase domain-containing protein [candidate division Zixibacteria bacterium]MDM7974025.1 UvrD-helicase domain-containing protein [candidate division Zixibacteria bacterium]HPM38346.1 UvrD-helicase domain-containing protein [candidate division Zixibacteria bacterium]